MNNQEPPSFHNRKQSLIKAPRYKHSPNAPYSYSAVHSLDQIYLHVIPFTLHDLKRKSSSSQHLHAEVQCQHDSTAWGLLGLMQPPHSRPQHPPRPAHSIRCHSEMYHSLFHRRPQSVHFIGSSGKRLRLLWASRFRRQMTPSSERSSFWGFCDTRVLKVSEGRFEPLGE
jgi:hypothetical protein